MATEIIFKTDEHIHFWLIKIADYHENELLFLEKLLNTEEKDRAKRFHFKKDRKRYIVTHGVLRQLLAKYLNASALVTAKK